jgi:hypothetical protein
MKKRMGGVSGAIAMVLTWAFVWAIPGGAIEALSNLGLELSFASNVDMWPQTLAIPGFVGGLVFSALLAVVERGRGLEGLSLGLLAGLGVIVGLLVGGIFMAAGWIGGESAPYEFAFTTVMGGVAAVASGLLFRYLARRKVPARA